jgi:Co/Zn/Cd efflux system component
MKMIANSELPAVKSLICTPRMTYGFYRAEALGALATVVIIWYVTGILSYLAVERLHTGQFEIQVGSTEFS